MIINRLALTGFKTFKERTCFDLHKKTLIVGDNFQGKTTIGEAIAYAFCGISLNGEVRNIEDLINNESNSLEIEIDFKDDFDRTHKLIRVKDRQSQAVYLDNLEEPATQTQINSLISDPKFFLSCFNLQFFQQELDDNERRALITQYTPPVDMQKLFGEMAEAKLISKYRIELQKSGNNEYTRINGLRNQAEQNIKEIQTKIKMLEDQNNNDTSAMTTNHYIIDEEKEKQLLEKISKIRSLEEHNNKVKVAYEIYVQKFNEYSSYLEKLKIIREEYQQYHDIVEPKSFGISEECQNISLEIEQLRSKLFPDISHLQESCPVCGGLITAEKVSENQEKNKLVLELIKQKQDFIKEKESEDVSSYAYFSKKLQRKIQLESEINFILNYVRTVPEKPTETMYDLSGFKNIIDEYSILNNLNTENKMKNAEIANRVNQINERLGEIQKLKQQHTELKNQFNELGCASLALSPTNGISRKAFEIKAEFIKKEFNKCSIILEKIQKNGEIKECFEIYYKDKPYRRLSYSEQVLCSLEIARYLRQQNGRNLPIFIDNSESITNIEDDLLVSDQVIYCLVQAGHQFEIKKM